MLKKRIWYLKASLVVVPSIMLVLVIVVLPYLVVGHYTKTIALDVYLAVMAFIMLLRSKDMFGFKPSRTYDQVTTILIWCISLPVFIFLGGFAVIVVFLAHETLKTKIIKALIVSGIISIFSIHLAIVILLTVSLPLISLSLIKNITNRVMWIFSITILFIFGIRLEIIGQMIKGLQIITVVNHCSWIDDVLNSLLMGWKKWKVVFAAEVKRIALASFFLRYIGIPINRTDQTSRTMVLRKLFAILKMGFNILLYPEGKRLRVNKNKEIEQPILEEFEEGAFALSKKTKIPIQPVVNSWTFRFKPRTGQWWYSPRKISMIYLDPMYCEENETPKQFSVRVHDLMECTLSKYIKKEEEENNQLLE